MAHDVFISYSTKDKTIADAVCAKLEADRIRCWITPRDIRAGADWNNAIIEAISASRVMVLIWSLNSNNSRDVTREVKHAFRQDITVIPFRTEDVHPSKSLEYYLALVHWLDASTPPLKDHIQRLSEHVKSVLQQCNPITADNKGDALLSKEDYSSNMPARRLGRKARRKWIMAVSITACALLAVIVIAWWRYKSRSSAAHEVSVSPAPDGRLTFKVEYPVVYGKWVYRGWDPERLLKKPVMERLRLEDRLRQLMKVGFGDDANTQWHAIHLYSDLQPPLKALNLIDNKLSCSSCHKTGYLGANLDREAPRSTCAECHVIN